MNYTISSMLLYLLLHVLQGPALLRGCTYVFQIHPTGEYLYLINVAGRFVR